MEGGGGEGGVPPRGPGPPGGGGGRAGGEGGRAEPGTVQAVYLAARAFMAAGAGEGGEEPPELRALLRACEAVSAREVGLDAWPIGGTVAEAGGGPAHSDGVIHRFRQSVAGTQKPSYMPIYQDEEVELGAFLLPAGCSMPLHDHPGMTVVSKVLTGRMKMRSLDWAAPPPTDWAVGGQTARMANIVRDAVLEPATPAVALMPHSGGNIHELRAETACAFLDVLLPPYTVEGCGYYNVEGLLEEKAPGAQIGLRQVQPPEDFYIEKFEYTGAQVIP